MRNVLAEAIPDWLAGAGQQQFVRLVMPVLIAVLVVMIVRIATDEDPREKTRHLLRADLRQLGYRRFTPAKRWFSAFTVSLAEAQSVVQGDEPHDEVIDIEALDAESELLDKLGKYADSDEIRDLRELVSHFRSQVLAEAGNSIVPGLSETWVGYGTQQTTGVGLLAERETNLRIYNANDLGRQLLSRTVTRGIAPGTGVKRRSIAFIAIGAEEPSPSDVQRSLAEIRSVDNVGGRRVKLVHSLLDVAEDNSVQAETSDRLVEAIQRGSRELGKRGETRAWTSEPDGKQWNRSWTATTIVSSGPVDHLPLLRASKYP